MEHNTIKIERIVDGRLRQRTYVGYTYEIAKAKFNQEFNIQDDE